MIRAPFCLKLDFKMVIFENIVPVVDSMARITVPAFTRLVAIFAGRLLYDRYHLCSFDDYILAPQLGLYRFL
jgi:hypothetical protein